MGHIMNGGKDAHLKMLRLDRERRARDNRKNLDWLDSMAGIDKLEYEIGCLQNTIRLAKYDLSSASFAGNQAIINKLNYAENNLKIKQEELAKLKLAQDNLSKKEELKVEK